MDYEEPAQTITSASQERRSRKIVLSLVLPTKGTDAETSVVLQSVVNQLSQSHFPLYRVVRTTGRRFTLVPSPSAGMVILNTPIVLATKPRSISQTVDAILAAVEVKCRCRFVQGGIFSNEFGQTGVTVGSSKATPARDLLAQALSGTKSVWIQTFDPDMNAFARRLEGREQSRSSRPGQRMGDLSSADVATGGCFGSLRRAHFAGDSRRRGKRDSL